jgi:hypothetical protein
MKKPVGSEAGTPGDVLLTQDPTGLAMTRFDEETVEKTRQVCRRTPYRYRVAYYTYRKNQEPSTQNHVRAYSYTRPMEPILIILFEW